jgi:hypothetical protein
VNQEVKGVGQGATKIAAREAAALQALQNLNINFNT